MAASRRRKSHQSHAAAENTQGPSTEAAASASKETDTSRSASTIQNCSSNESCAVTSPSDESCSSKTLSLSALNLPLLIEQTIDEVRGASSKAVLETKKVYESVSRKLYYTFHELPAHLQDNDCIIGGYRAYYSIKECAMSIFRIHNETMNIWTHLVGSLFYFSLLFITVYNLPTGASYSDFCIMAVFLVSAVKCLFCSSAFHTFCAHRTRHFHDRFQSLDYCGISSLVCGSFITYLHYGFYEKTFWQVFYYAMLGALNVAGFAIPWFRFFRRVEFRIWRTVFYVSMGVCLFLLCIHAMLDMGVARFTQMVGLRNIFGECAIYLVGALIYASRVPERLFPGKVDILFSSHQIWHIFILIASYFHYCGTICMMNARILESTGIRTTNNSSSIITNKF